MGFTSENLITNTAAGFFLGEFEFTSSTRDTSKKDPSTGYASSSSIYGFL
jgi:hypothetical protein